ncbi:MAG: hypothetical protein GY711_12760 [bacterium]|nr:hypothetical protein [bacterium]
MTILASPLLALAGTTLVTGVLAHGLDDPAFTVDLQTVTAGVDPLIRVSGPGPHLGSNGVPVAGGFDVDGDGFNDFAVGHFVSSPLGRNEAGEVNLVFGDGTVSMDVDLGVANPGRVVRILGEGNLGAREGTGSEIWMSDVTGDGLGDLLICRQNFSFNPGGGNRVGAGALTIVVGGPALRTLDTIDLASPPTGVTLFHLYGRQTSGRLGIWARAGDVDGDGTDDLVVAADQENVAGETHSGTVYVVRGGSHLNQSAVVDLANFGSTILAGNLARILPPDGANHYHFGSTNQTGDLDGNGRHEILASAGLNRAGAAQTPGIPGAGATDATGGAGPNGWAFVIWDDNFPAAPWQAGLEIDLQSPPGSRTIIRGGTFDNDTFGEELLGGLDYDGDNNAELFVGDLTGGNGAFFQGVGYVIYDAQSVRGMDFVIDDAGSLGIDVTKIIGAGTLAILADTVAQGDFNADGYGDLMIGSPLYAPLGRSEAGLMHILFGQQGQWPSLIETAPGQFPDQSLITITEVVGALGTSGQDSGDTLCYSAAAGDLDGDGRTDVITNEMEGNGPGATDAGNLIVLSGELVSPPEPFVAFCTGDGAGAACPCGNESASGSGEGCRNSTGTGSALTASGSPSVAADDLTFAHSGPPNQFGLFFVGDTSLSGTPFGDGLRCAGGNIVRLSLQLSDGAGNMSFGPGLGAIGGWGMGETLPFQVFYRDLLSSPCSTGFNASNGMMVTFEP